jgi:ABC-type branched-subunit amino acid transport system ATPase component
MVSGAPRSGSRFESCRARQSSLAAQATAPQAILFRVKAQGTTVLLIEQNVERAVDIADRACVPDQGAVVYHAAREP